MRRFPRTGLALAALDLLIALFAISYPEPPKPRSAIETAGAYAVTVTWDCTADVDLHVKTPDGNHIFYANQQGGGASLELDDLGRLNSYAGRQVERVVVRRPQVGEYAVAVHLYDTHGCKTPVAVWVALWQLSGQDRVLLQQQVTLPVEGDARTAFRFVLNKRLEYKGFNRLSWDIFG